MEEDICKDKNIADIVAADATISEDEGDNWTFVHSEEISCNKIIPSTNNQQEDSSDNYSEQESDSGSSIVVIDSPSSVPNPDMAALAQSQAHTNNLDKEQVECLEAGQDDISCSSQQSSSTSTDFLKECSPYEDIDQPDSWDCDDTSQVVDETLVDTPSCHQESIPQQTDLAIETHNEPSSPILQINCSSVVEQLEDDNGLEVIENSSSMNNSVSLEDKQEEIETQDDPAEHPDNNANLPEENVADGVDDVIESEDETWDLDLGALVNNASLSSSVSSLVQEPEPVPAFHASTVKPDLLEEANRIEELDLMDYSAVTNPDLPPELTVANIIRDRHYVHRRDQRLNVQLSFFVAFALAAVVGFALGNIVGLSDNFPSRCQPSEMKQENSRGYEGWTDGDLRAELERLKMSNEELSRALNEMSVTQNPANCQSNQFGFQVSELMTENWDLKQSIGRIRYGKPVRSIEDRDTINRLQTENQDLRATVGKLRYRCVQPVVNTQRQEPEPEDASPVQPFVQSHSTQSEPLWKSLGAMNLTNSWNRLNNQQKNRSTEEKLRSVTASAADLIQFIGVRREELINLTRGNNGRRFDKMEATFKKSAEKTIALMERVEKHHKSFDELLSETEHRLSKMRFKLETYWTNLLLTKSDGGGSIQTSAGHAKPVNADWFFSMGQQREKMRRSDKQSDWMFDRARNRDQERRTRKFQVKNNNKKQKDYQSSSWNLYSS